MGDKVGNAMATFSDTTKGPNEVTAVGDYPKGSSVVTVPPVHPSITGLLAIISVLGVIANILLIAALVRRNSRKVTSNLYLVNLAVGETCVLLLPCFQ